MPIYLVRHGETSLNAARRKQGKCDAPLTQRGIDTVLKSAETLRRLVPNPKALLFLCSPLGRARQSAALIADRLGLDVAGMRIEPLLRELDFGAWEGLSDAEIRERFPDQLAEHTADRWHVAPPGGESFAACVARARTWLSDHAPHVNILAVTHGYLLRALRGAYLDLPDAGILALPIVQGTVYEFAHGEVFEHAD